MAYPLKWYRELAEVKARRERGVFLVEGPRAVSEVARAAPAAIREVVLVEGRTPPDGAWPVRVVSPRQFDQIAVSRAPQGILAVVALPEGSYGDQTPDKLGGNVLVCEHIQDPGNVGALIRSAAAFGFGGVVLSDACADPFAPKSVQSSAGTVLSLWIRKTRAYIDIIQALRTQGYSLVAADAHGRTDVDWKGVSPAALALGSEGAGLSAELRAMADIVFTIPIDTSRVESLNVAAAGAVAMYCIGRSDGVMV